jgi:hypothetical protein
MTAWTDRIATLTQPKWWIKLDGTSANSSPTTESNSGDFGAWVSVTANGSTSGCIARANGISNNYWEFPNGSNSSTGRRNFAFKPTSGNDSAAIFSSAWTLEFWFRISNISQGDSDQFGILNFEASAATAYIDVRIPRTGLTDAGKLIVQFSGNSASPAIVSTNTVNDGSWKHAVFTYGGSANSHRKRLYINGVQQGSDNTTSPGSNLYTIFDRYSTLKIGHSRGGASTESYRGDLDEVLIYNYELTSSQVSGNYNAGNPAVSINYTNTTGATASATSPNATVTTTTVINTTQSADPLIANTATLVQPALSIGINVDGGGVSTASALAVDPTITITKNADYSADPFTASATSPDSTVSTTRSVNYSADPATASALLSSNFYGGGTGQDTSYSLTLRELVTDTAANTNANGGFSIGRYKTGSTITTNQKILLIIPNSGLPEINKIIKVKFDSAHVSASSTNDIAPNNRFNVYKVTTEIANPTNITFSEINKTLLYTTRLLDDSTDGNSNFYLDLTPAFADSQAYANGVLVESFNDGTSYSGWDETVFSGSNLNNHLLYILSSGLINKNVNADPMTASALATDAVIDTQKYVNLSVDPSTASAESVTPEVGLSIGFNADPSTASGLAVQPTFSRTVEFPHTFATAHADISNPTVFAFGTITYAAVAATASAELHMPQFDIGENNSADHMNASAEFVMPGLILSRSVAAMTTTASTLFVDPVVNAQLLGAVLASPMTANAMSPNPPAYTNLFGDEWFAALYAQHSIKAVGHPFGYNSAFLKLYEDQNTDITQSTPNTNVIVNGLTVRTLRQLFNNLTQTIITNGSVADEGLPGGVADVITDYSIPENESRLSVGYFDAYGRKAVRLQNIGIRMARPLFHARSDFSLEFSIKTTKADQVLSYGEWSSQYGPQRIRNLYNLVDGKINTFLYNDDYRIVHPKQRYGDTVVSGTTIHGITGYKRIDDGEWHHVIIQYVQGSTDDGEQQGRYQVWIDGALDIQRFGARLYEPDYFGSNLENATYAPDFYTSATSLDAPSFISERDTKLHYFNYIKYAPILAEPMTASLTATPNNKGKGNRKRALMLYWWPSNTGQNKNLITRTFDTGRESSSFPDFPMFDQELDTIDYVKQPPQQYYGWDVFPVDINGYYVSDLVKEEAYGGAGLIALNDVGGAVGPFDGPRLQFKVNRAGFFRKEKDDTRRYIDLVNDIDLSQFDAIFFKNYPDQSREQESFSKNEIVDTYFNIRETVIFEEFIKSLRAAVDTGISLMVNNPQLALDLKIVDRIELVPDLNDTTGYQSDPYSPTVVPNAAKGLPINTGNTANLWWDAHRNNRIRVLNTLPGLTDWRSVVRTKMAYWSNDDTIDFGGSDRIFSDYELKPNGLAVGDEFFLSTTDFKYNTYFGQLVAATPINNVLAGTPITAFANQYRRGLDLVDNPYKDHVTSIAIKPGDVLNGRQVGGKIWVNFTEPISNAFEEASIDAIHTEWIEAAYFDGTITLQERNDLISSINNLETRLNQGTITQAEYNDLSAWASNGMYLLSQSREIEAGDPGRSDFGGENARKGTVRKTSRSGITSSAPVSFNQQWFLFTYSKQFRQLFFDVISMTTRGFRWISDRVETVAQTQTHTAMPASATMVQPVVVGDKQNNITVQPMLANAIKVPAVGFAGTDRNIISLPLEASANIVQPVKKVSAEPMTASAAFRDQSVIRTTAQDQVVVYVLHEDPILYLREDIIK